MADKQHDTELEIAIARDKILSSLFPRAAKKRRARTIGRFEVLDLIGSGGMGAVYSARDPELDRRVAIKLLHRELLGADHGEVEMIQDVGGALGSAETVDRDRGDRSPRSPGPSADSPSSLQRRARVLREAKAMARVSHHNVVQVYEVGEHNGRLFIAMEFVEGETLRSWMEAHARPWREVLDVFKSAGRGLAAAHRAGLIHRDFKPENVLLSDDGRVCVADFGLVRVTGGERALEPKRGGGDGGGDASILETISAREDAIEFMRTMTRAGALMGTPGYMAPEQFQGVPGDTRADQFSFCTSLWEALHGVAPFAADNLVDFVDKMTRGQIDAPPAGVDVPLWLQGVLRRGLEVNPEDRWPSIEALLGELERDPEQDRVQCGRCEAMNRRGRQYCTRCGAALEIRCRACGDLNAAQATFCGACGSSLSARGGERARHLAASGTMTAERREVALLHARVVDLDGHARSLDPERLHQLVRRFEALADHTIPRHGGTLQARGDAILAVFGAPIAHGNDLVRCGRAALALRDAAATARERDGLPLELAMGLTSGELILSTSERPSGQELTVTGAVVHEARSLSALARAGELRASDALRRRVDRRLLFEQVPEDMSITTAATGDVPTAAACRWRLVDRLRDDAVAPARHAPLVGRTRELARFTATVDSCLKRGRGRTIYLRADAGLGKTRLMEAFAALARDRGFVTHRGLVFDFGGERGEEGLITLVYGLLELPSGSDVAAREAALARAMARGWLSIRQRPFLYDLLDLPRTPVFRALYESMDRAAREAGKRDILRHLVEVASAVQPRVLLVEDVHWAGPQALKNLAELAVTVAECPALLVMSTRVAADPFAGERLSVPWDIIDLAPLRRDEALELARLSGAADPAKIRRCVARAEGNAMFLEQLLRAAEDSDEIPGSVQNVVLARLDRLPARDRQSVKAAAVLGQRFSLEAVRFMVDDPGYDLARPLAHRLVRPEGAGFLFGHALIRDGVYAALVGESRRALHRRAAEWYARRDAGMRARHLARADDPRAASAFLEAAREHHAALRITRALEYVELGVEHAREPPERYELLSLKGHVLKDIGDYDRSVRVYDEAHALAVDDLQRCRAAVGSAWGFRGTDSYDEALQVLDRAEAIARAHHPALCRERAELHHLRGNIMFALGRFETCRKEQTTALSFAREARAPDLEAKAHGGVGDVNYALGLWRTARAHFARCIALSRAHGFLRTELANRPMVLISEYGVRPLGQVAEETTEAFEAAGRIGHTRARMLAGIVICECLAELTRWEQLRDHATRCLALVEQMGARRFIPHMHLFIAIAEFFARERERARARCRAAVEQTRHDASPYCDAMALGYLALFTDDADERARALADSEALMAARVPLSHNQIFYRRSAIDALLDAGDHEGALRHAAALADYTSASEMPYAYFLVERAGALARHVSGERSAELTGELQRLRDHGRRCELLLSTGRLDQVCAQLERVRPGP